MKDSRVAIEESLAISQAQASVPLPQSTLDSIEAVSEAIASNPRLLMVSGVGTSSNAGRKFCDSLATVSIPAVFVDPNDALHGRLGVLPHVGMAVLVSHSGNTEELLLMEEFLSKEGVPTAVVTSAIDSRLAGRCTYKICYGHTVESDPFAVLPTASFIRTLIILDALLAGAMVAAGVTADTLRKSHPSGSLSAQLSQRICALITDRGTIETVSVEATIAEASQLITSLGFGGVVIEEAGVLLGVLSDGDLRRLVGRGASVDGHRVTVGQVMNSNPFTLDSDQLVQDVAAEIRRGTLGQGFFSCCAGWEATWCPVSS